MNDWWRSSANQSISWQKRTRKTVFVARLSRAKLQFKLCVVCYNRWHEKGPLMPRSDRESCWFRVFIRISAIHPSLTPKAPCLPRKTFLSWLSGLDSIDIPCTSLIESHVPRLQEIPFDDKSCLCHQNVNWHVHIFQRSCLCRLQDCIISTTKLHKSFMLTTFSCNKGLVHPGRKKIYVDYASWCIQSYLKNCCTSKSFLQLSRLMPEEYFCTSTRPTFSAFLDFASFFLSRCKRGKSKIVDKKDLNFLFRSLCVADFHGKRKQAIQRLRLAAAIVCCVYNPFDWILERKWYGKMRL